VALATIRLPYARSRVNGSTLCGRYIVADIHGSIATSPLTPRQPERSNRPREKRFVATRS
jgi:hypothetical protein